MSDPILFHWWGTDWPVSKVCLVLGIVLAILGVLQGAVLAIHTRAVVRRFTPSEAGDIAFNAGRGLLRNIRGKGIGASIEMSASIGSLRKAARRGDWLTFWLWPAWLSCWFGGFWLVFIALIFEEPLFVVMISLFMLPMIGIVLFLPWAAIYTNIEKDPAEKDPPSARP